MKPLARTIPSFAIAAAATTASALLCACNTPLQDAQALSLAGQHDRAMVVLDAEAARSPDDHAVRAAQVRERELALAQWRYAAESARDAGQLEVARQYLARILAIDPHDAQALVLRQRLERDAGHVQALAEATRLMDAGRISEAQARVQQVLLEAPGLPAAQVLQRRIAGHLSATAPAPATLGPRFQKPLTLEFHDAPLHQVFDSLARAAGLNFVFDREVKGDAKVTIQLRGVTLDDALRTILVTQQLDRKLLNDQTVFVYPDTPNKQREHQELVTRSFYLANADVKQAEKLIRTMAKSKDLYLDERLNLVVVRDTPAVIQFIERLVASIDMAEPEVMLDVQVMEIGTNVLDTLGVQWPSSIDVGLPLPTTGDAGSSVGVGVGTGTSTAPVQIDLRNLHGLTAFVSNPAIVAKVFGTSGTSNLLANPKLRARNHEKARVQIGEKLPVFTTTSTANVGVSTTVTYVDTGLKLEVEPSVQLDGDVVMRVNLDVTNLIGSVTGPEGSVAYNVGTRNATTSLRVHDGETQILAGLINDEDSKGIQGLPGLANLPVLGRLFGVHTDTRNKSEIVLLITPRVVRNIGLPDATVMVGPAGSESSPGAESLQFRGSGSINVPARADGRRRGGDVQVIARAADAAPAVVPPPPQAPTDGTATLALRVQGRVAPGETATVGLQNASEAMLTGLFAFDSAVFELVSAPGGSDGRVAFQIAPHGQQVIVLRASQGAEGRASSVRILDLSAQDAAGLAVPARIDGTGEILVRAGN